MVNNLLIPELSEKIELLLRSDKNAIKTNNQLSMKLGIGYDYLSRIKNGARTLSEENFLKLCGVFGLQQRDWFEDLEAFGQKLGFSRRQTAVIASRPLPGIDFNSRLKDKKMLEDLLDVVGGYWEAYYYAVSKTNEQLISRDLCVIKEVNEDGYITCEVTDAAFHYQGWCFPIKGQLCFLLEKSKLWNEIIYDVTNLPDRIPPRLSGIMLCISGGVDENHSYPSAARVAFRYLGKAAHDVRQTLSLKNNETIDGYLQKSIPKVLKPKDVDKMILGKINNHIARDAVPLALRMEQ